MKTCLDCIFECPCATFEPCENFKDAAMFGKDMFKYHIFQSDSIEILTNPVPIGVANSYKEACKVVKDYLAVNAVHCESQWRFLLGENATFIDYGSWSKFMVIVPPISLRELNGEDA